MSQTAVLVWLSAAAVLPTFRADLDGFAQSRLMRLEAPRENLAAFRTSAYAPDAVARIESSLEEARNAAASLEQSRALATLERADSMLRDHPELPQSAWLMAEALELSAEVESSAPDGADSAAALRGRAAALEGPRAAPFSDRPGLAEPGLAEPGLAEPGLAEEEVATAPALSVSGLEPGDTLEWDGIAQTVQLRATPGEHHARVVRNARLVWAGWVKVIAGDVSVQLPVPETVACSADDIGAGHIAGGLAVAAPHARCDSYVLARAHAGGGIEAALCEREACGKVTTWDRRIAPRAAHTNYWPYAIAASAGALLVTGVALWRAGAFDRPAPGTTERWVFSGQKQMALSF